MNSNTPYNSGVMKNMVNKVKVYCSRIIPLVFDNTLSYYETLCGFCAKVNELCDAVNSQNLAITEFCHMVELEIEKFKEYVDTQISTINETISDVLDRVRDIESTVGDIQTALANKVDKSDVVNTVEANNENPVTSGAVYEAIQESSGTTVREAQANPTNGIVKGIVTTDFQQLANPLSIRNGVLAIREATKNVTGYVQVGDNINVNAGVISVPLASPTAKGLVMASNVDSGITAYNGTIRINLADPLYIDTQHNRVDIKYATNTQLGVVAPKLGGALNIQSAGEIDAKDATTTQKGVVTLTDTITDGDTSHVPTADAVYEALQQGGGGGTVPDATIDVKGIVKPGAGLTIATATPGVITLNTATRNVIGGVKVGDNLVINDSVLSVPDASTLTKGVMSVGSGLVASQGLVYLAEASDSAIGGVIIGDALKIDVNGKLTIDSDATIGVTQTGKLTVRTATPDNVGLVTIDGTNSNLTLAYGKLDVPTGSRDTKGVLQVGSNINVGNGVISVPTATPGTLGVATIADTGSNLTMGAGGVIDVPTASVGTKGVMTLSQHQDELYLSNNGELGINAATANRKGVVQVGTNIDVTNGVISVPSATVGVSGVVTKTNTVAYGSTAVPTSGAVYDAIVSMLQNGGFSRTLQLEHDNNPDGGAECILVRASSIDDNIMPASTNIINGNGINNTRAVVSSSNEVIHIFVKTSLYPTGLDYTSQAYCTTLECKFQFNNTSPNSLNGFVPYGIYKDNNSTVSLGAQINVGNTFTNSNGEAYRHIILGNSTTSGKYIFRVKIDY